MLRRMRPKRVTRRRFRHPTMCPTRVRAAGDFRVYSPPNNRLPRLINCLANDFPVILFARWQFRNRTLPPGGSRYAFGRIPRKGTFFETRCSSAKPHLLSESHFFASSFAAGYSIRHVRCDAHSVADRSRRSPRAKHGPRICSKSVVMNPSNGRYQD